MKAINFLNDNLNEPAEVVYKAFAEDDGISKPTKERYDESKKRCSEYSDWIRRSRKRQDELLDALFEERQSEKDYRGMYEAHRELVRRYELYEDIEHNNG